MSGLYAHKEDPMRRLYVTSVLLAGAAFASGCGDETRPPLTTQPTQVSRGPVSTADISAQIDVVFRAESRPAARAQFDLMSKDLSEGKTKSAHERAMGLLGLALNEVEKGGDEDPNHIQAFLKFLCWLSQYIKLDGNFCSLDPRAFGADGKIAIVGPGGATLVTPSHNAAMVIPPGFFSTNELVTILRQPDQTQIVDPRFPPTSQWPLVFDFSVNPPMTPPYPIDGKRVELDVCQYLDGPNSPPDYLHNPNTEVGGNYLYLARQRAEGAQVLFPQIISPPLLRGCTNAAFGMIPLDLRKGVWPALEQLASRAADFLSPEPLYGIHAGLGGTVGRPCCSTVKAVEYHRSY